MRNKPSSEIRRRSWKMMPCLFLVVAIGNRSGFAQQGTCSDTIQTVLHTSPLFQPGRPFFSLATKDGGSAIFQSVPNAGKASILLYKTSASGNPDWGKIIRVVSSFPLDNVKELDDGTMAINSQVFGAAQSLSSAHLLVDSGGNVVWQGDYSNADLDTGTQVINSGSPGTIVWAGSRLLSNGGGMTVQYFDYVNEAEIWRRNVGVNNLSSLQLFLCGIVFKNNQVYIAGVYLDMQTTRLDKGIWLVGLDANTGDILEASSYQIADPPDGSKKLVPLGKGQFMNGSGSGLALSVDLVDQVTGSKGVAYLSVDGYLRITHPALCLFSRLNESGSSSSLMNAGGDALYSFISPRGVGYFAAIDATDSVSRQYKVSFSQGQGGNIMQTNLSDNGQVVAVEPVVQGAQLSFEITRIPPDLSSGNACVSITDTGFVQPYVPSLLPSNIQWIPQSALPRVGVASPVVQPPVDFALNSTVLCQHITACQQLSISGESQVCLSDSLLLFTATRNKECTRSIQWLTGDSLLSIVASPTDSTVLVKATRAARVYLRAQVKGCSVTDSLLIQIHEPALLDEHTQDVCKHAQIYLSADTGFEQYTWSPAAQIVGDNHGRSVLIRPESDMIYSVTATSESGCVQTDSVAISVTICGEWLSMPNAFTPNDDGKNDVICPKVTGTLVHYSFSIFNRWGQRVFVSATPGKGWDGRVNGNKQGDGTYAWICEYQFSGGVVQVDKGTFLLIR